MKQKLIMVLLLAVSAAARAGHITRDFRRISALWAVV